MTEIKKLEIKHIAPYLPYGLKWGFEGEDITHEVVGLDIISTGVKLISPYYNYGSCEINNGRPLLRPMSDLYKEINGEVGINVIGKMFEPNGVLNFEDGNYYYGWNTHVCDDYQGYEIGWIEEVGWFGIFFDTYDYENQKENFTGDYLPYNRNVAEYLDRKHFDWRYDLIIKGLAIDKNTIKE